MLRKPAFEGDYIDPETLTPNPRVVLMWLFRSFPVIATFSWFFTLFSLLFAWTILDQATSYQWYLGGMPFVANIVAVHQTLFIVGGMMTGTFFAMSLYAERFLRFLRVLTEASEERWLWFSVGVLDVVIGTLGGLSLMLLGFFDVVAFPVFHHALMSTFIIAVAVSGLLQTCEVEHLWHEHPDRTDLRESTIAKYCFLGFAILFGAGFWILYYICKGNATREGQCYAITTASAICEWLACFSCGGYFATLILDIWPAYRHSPIVQKMYATTQGVQGILALQPDGSYTKLPFEYLKDEKRIPVGLTDLFQQVYGNRTEGGGEIFVRRTRRKQSAQP